ncbi:MAG TPA: hypothetical protein H9666_01875 [Firmicutes bacterium]|nr:hypothetical protein [Bacillota bacterium]
MDISWQGLPVATPVPKLEIRGSIFDAQPHDVFIAVPFDFAAMLPLSGIRCKPVSQSRETMCHVCWLRLYAIFGKSQ